MSEIYWLRTPPHDYLVVPLDAYPDAERFGNGMSPIFMGRIYLNESDTAFFLAGEGDLDPDTFPERHEQHAPPPMVTVDMLDEHGFDIDDFLRTLYRTPWDEHLVGDA